MSINGVRTRLAQLLGMLGSKFDGEVLNAARLANQLVKDQGLQWGEVVEAHASTPAWDHKTGGAAEKGGGQEGSAYRAGLEAGLARGAELAAAAIKSEYHRGFKDGVNSKQRVDRWWKEWAKQRCINDKELLSDWEFSFFESFAVGRHVVPSGKQRAIFERVAARLDLEFPE